MRNFFLIALLQFSGMLVGFGQNASSNLNEIDEYVIWIDSITTIDSIEMEIACDIGHSGGSFQGYRYKGNLVYRITILFTENENGTVSYEEYFNNGTRIFCCLYWWEPKNYSSSYTSSSYFSNDKMIHHYESSGRDVLPAEVNEIIKDVH